MASLMRRTLVRSGAPIFNSLRRMVPQQARANWANAAQAANQDIGHRGKPQAQLVGPHGVRREPAPGLNRGAVGTEVELAVPRFREGRLLMRFSISPRAQ